MPQIIHFNPLQKAKKHDKVLYMKRTYKGKKSVVRKIGFRARSATAGGRNVLRDRRSKGRHVISYSDRIDRQKQKSR